MKQVQSERVEEDFTTDIRKDHMDVIAKALGFRRLNRLQWIRVRSLLVREQGISPERLEGMVELILENPIQP